MLLVNMTSKGFIIWKCSLTVIQTTLLKIVPHKHEYDQCVAFTGQSWIFSKSTETEQKQKRQGIFAGVNVGGWLLLTVVGRGLSLSTVSSSVTGFLYLNLVKILCSKWESTNQILSQSNFLSRWFYWWKNVLYIHKV